MMGKKHAHEQLDTCCHPISMASVTVMYSQVNLQTNTTSVVSSVLPNMVVTECGCS